jgi:hypothetical protein
LAQDVLDELRRVDAEVGNLPDAASDDLALDADLV